MLLQLITNNSFDRLAVALCNTLMHSLWQGILLTAIAGLIIMCTRKASSALRYNLLIAALLFFAITVSVTFVWQYDRSRPTIATGMQPLTNMYGNPVQSIHLYSGAQALQQPLTVKINNFLSEHHYSIVFFWFLIVCARCLQLAFGLYGIYRLRRVQVTIVKGDWQNRLRLMADDFRLSKAVTLLESGLAKVPMVIGHLKPVILVPLGLLNALSAEEVEAILIHELAHINRRDYLVNMLQSFMEIVFFFNPAVLWVSKLIKTERENCCDDLAVAQNNNKINYIRALVSCEEYQSSVPAYAMGLTGEKNTLLNRVKRLVNNRNYSLNLFEKTVLAVCLILFALGVSAFTAREHIQKALNSFVAVKHHDIKAGHTVKAVVDTTHKKQEAQRNNANESLNPVSQHHKDTLITTGSPALDILVHTLDSLKVNVRYKPPMTQLAEPDTTPVQTLRMTYKGSNDQVHEIGRELYRENLLTDTQHVSISLSELELVVNGVRMPEDVHIRIYNQFGNGINNSGSLASPYENSYPGPHDNFIKQRSEEIAYELIKENLVKDKTYFTYKLSRDEFSIDGIKQPEELRRRIIDKYFKPDDNFNIGYSFREPGIYGGSGSSYNHSSAEYQHQSEDQKRYWAGQQIKIIDEMAREGLINDRHDLSFTLTDKTFVINGLVQNNEVFQRYHQEYAPVHSGDNWVWNCIVNPGNNSTDAYRSRDWDAYSRQESADRQRMEADRDKKLVADLMQDGLITDPNNVVFTLTGKDLTINGKKQSNEIFQKYKEKYEPNAGSGSSWTYSHHE
ncbi:MAG TPA: M56 family metallopeptidase [Puia sp.]|nr:M56 family metallopeptidase [Puia sp.]